MSSNEYNIEEIRKELQWVNVNDGYFQGNKSGMNKVYKILVPTGVLVTTGILVSGLYFMLKRNSRKQQLLMRYRVLAQGITVGIATLGVFHVRFAS